MSKPFTIVLPVPPRELSPNSRAYWRKKAKATKMVRENTCVVARDKMRSIRGLGAPWLEATVQLTYQFNTHRRRDTDNLLAMAKAVFDGLTDSCLILDDAGLTHLPVDVNIVAGEEQTLTVEVWET